MNDVFVTDYIRIAHNLHLMAGERPTFRATKLEVASCSARTRVARQGAGQKRKRRGFRSRKVVKG
jgi:hypothetical protein